MTPPLSRRHFLRAAGSLIALPALESVGFRAFAAAPPAVSPKRMVFLGFGFGVTADTWFPDVKTTGADYVLPPGLAPLARHQADFTVLQGCSNKFSNEAHWGSTFWLTGANRYAEAGQSFHNSISADQVAAAHLGANTRFTSLQLGTENASESGHGPGSSLAWDSHGKPISGFDTPVVAFHRLFSDDTTPLEQRQAMLSQQRSVLDAVLTDANRLRRRVSHYDADKLDEYYQSIRDIETRLGKEEKWLTVPKARPDLAEPRPSLEGKEEIAMMYDLIVAALRTDSTRVVTYRQPVGTLLKSLGTSVTPHNMSHYAGQERTEVSRMRDEAQSQLLAGFFDKLKSVKDAQGQSLFDSTSIVYGSNIRTVHYLENCPTIIAGRGAGVKLGQHIVLPGKSTPLCNAWLTLLQGVGVPATSHGDSTGIIKELVA